MLPLNFVKIVEFSEFRECIQGKLCCFHDFMISFGNVGFSQGSKISHFPVNSGDNVG